MMAKRINLWYDPEADYLEVMFRQEAGVFRETDLDQVMEKLDSDGRLIGFSILKVSELRGRLLED